MLKSKIIFFIIMISLFSSNINASYEKLAFDFSFKDLDGSEMRLADFKDKVMVVTNVASYCGFTSQYEDLEKLHLKYDNLEVIGLPCNQFLFQEPFSEKKIQHFCQTNYSISFILTQKIKVKGKNQHELYKWLTSKSLNGEKNSRVTWNFQKYLIDKNGNFINYFSPKITPLSIEITNHLD